jgi:hypothetical protein
MRVFVIPALLVLAGCGAESEEPPDQGAPAFGTTDPPTTAKPVKSTPLPEEPTVALATNVDPATLSHPEVVQIVMPGKDGLIWFCTGALVSSTVVVTAAHCLQSTLFLSWDVIAPTLAAKPRVKGTPKMYDTGWAQVEKPDVGILRLEKPIELPRYAELTDVTARVDAREAISVATIVRTAELPYAPFKKTGNMPVTSTVPLGYTHGYGVPLYSRGGDSGAGMFLIENGQMTHKLIGVEREPDPANGVDHLTRVDGAFRQWVVTNGS